MASPARAPPSLLLLSGRIASESPPSPPPTLCPPTSHLLRHARALRVSNRSLSLTGGARRPCASMARDGLTGKVKPSLHVPRAATSSTARPRFNQSGVSRSSAVTRCLCWRPRLLPPAGRTRRTQRPGLAEAEHRGRGEGGVAGCACARHADCGGGRGACAEPGHLPHALLGPGSQPRTRLLAAAGALGMEVVLLGGRRRRKGGLLPHREAHFGVRRSPARRRGREVVHCGKGTERGWPRPWRAPAQLAEALTAPGAAASDAAVGCPGGQHRGRLDWREGDRGGAGSGALEHLQKAFVSNPQWEGPAVFRDPQAPLRSTPRRPGLWMFVLGPG